MASTPDELLDQAAAVWFSARLNYRDAMIEVGWILHEYVLAGLVSSEGLSERGRKAHDISRRNLLASAASRLNISIMKANDLIQTSVVARMLGSDYGKLSLSALRSFRPAIRRVRTKKTAWRNKGEPPEGYYPQSAAETWQFVPHLETPTREMFSRAVQENWSVDRARAEANQLYARGSRKHGQDKADRGRVDVDFFAVARNSTPKDLAELMKDMVRQSSDPVIVANLLKSHIRDLQLELSSRF